MKKLIMAVVGLSMMFSCSNDDQVTTTEPQNQADYYQGEMTGDIEAVIALHIEGDGNITGAYYVPTVSDFHFNGNVTDGSLWMLPEYEGDGARFVGYIENDTIYGNWQDGARNWNGEFKAWKR